MVGVEKVCTITVDLTRIPREAFERRIGPEGYYYHVTYQLAVIFGAVLEFRFMCDGDVVGEAIADYSR